MAKIKLDVVLNKGAVGEELKSLKQEISSAFGELPQSRSGSGINNLQKKWANLLNTIKNTKNYSDGIFKSWEDSAKEALAATKELNKEIGDGKPTDNQRKRYAELKTKLSEVSAGFATVRAENEKLQKANKLAIPNIDNLRKKYANLLNTIRSSEKNYAKGTFGKLTEEIQKNINTLSTLDPTTKDYAKTLNQLDKDLNRISADFAETRVTSENFKGSLKDIVTGFGKFQLAAMAVMIPLNLLKKAFASINETLDETEQQVISLRRVMREELAPGEISDEMYDLAIKYSSDINDVYDILSNFLRSGKSWNESLAATEAALKGITVAEMDAAQASEGLLAIMTQFKKPASELDNIVAILNKTADTYNVTTEKLITGLQKTGSYAKAANLEIEETVALLTVLSEGTNASGQNLGNALRSLLAYSTKDSSLEVYASLSDNMSDIVNKYRQGRASILDVWKGLGQEMNSLSGQQMTALMSLSENSGLEEELGVALEDIYDDLQGVYDTAGTYRKNYFIALLSEISKVEGIQENMMGAQEHLNKETEEALDTYNKKVEKLEAQWKDIANDQQGLLLIKSTIADIASETLDLVSLWSEFGSILRTDIGKTLGLDDEAISGFFDDWIKPLWGGYWIGGPIGGIVNLVSHHYNKNSTTGSGSTDPVEEQKELNTALKETIINYDKIIEKLEQINNAKAEELALEEKKRRVAEAERALEEAYKNRLVQVYNAETGDWDFVSDQKAINDAQANLDSALLQVEMDIYEEVKTIAEAAKAGGKSPEEIQTELDALFSKWNGAFGSDTERYNALMDEIFNLVLGGRVSTTTDTEGVNPEYQQKIDNLLAEGYAKTHFGGKYDSGGVLHGLGGIKATERPETVLDPDMTSKILDPTSNAQFSSFVNSLGLLFGVSKSLSTPNAGMTYGTNSRDSHDQYTVNGVPISQEMASSHTLKEIFDTLPLV